MDALYQGHHEHGLGRNPVVLRPRGPGPLDLVRELQGDLAFCYAFAHVSPRLSALRSTTTARRTRRCRSYAPPCTHQPPFSLVYHIDLGNEALQIAYPDALLGSSITDSRAIMCSVLTLPIANRSGMGDADYDECIY